MELIGYGVEGMVATAPMAAQVVLEVRGETEVLGVLGVLVGGRGCGRGFIKFRGEEGSMEWI
jgi:hypothetical protein